MGLVRRWVLAIYIRNVSRDAAQVAALEQLAAEVARVGSRLLLATDTFAVAPSMPRPGFSRTTWA